MNLEIKNINKTFAQTKGVFFGRGSSVRALSDISLTLKGGGSLGIVGESGSGKTTLAKILAGFLNADTGTAFLGSNNLLTLTRGKRAPLVQMVFQDPFASLNPKLLLGTQLFEAMRLAKNRIERENRAKELMQNVGLEPHHLNVYPHQLSGGQRQRFAIARALASEPKLLLADEPVSSLDVSVQAQIINLLNELKYRLKFSLILISHDLSVIANTCDETIVMKDGYVLEKGETNNILNNPQNDYTQRLLKAVQFIT